VHLTRERRPLLVAEAANRRVPNDPPHTPGGATPWRSAVGVEMREAAIKTGLFSKFRPKIAQLVLGLALAFASLLNSVQASGPVPSATFATEAAAQAHCPSDAVVWLNTNTGIYHEKGMRWYGRTKHGAYVCRKEADVAGDRDTRNGQ